MSIPTVKSVATRFLKSDKPEVLAIKGAWGIGKTFLWNELVQEHKNEIKLKNYCYVSLFGITSITELRIAILAKTRSVNFLDEKQNSKSTVRWLNTWILNPLKSFIQNLTRFRESPYSGYISSALGVLLAPHLIKDTIICLDDFERISTKSIRSDEILGFISELKEEKRCKVVIIFNENEIKDLENYKKFREKVIDMEISYAPTSEEAVDLALPNELFHRSIIKEYVISLDIRNIRILRKIVTFIELIKNEIYKLHKGVIERAIKISIIIVWCYYDSNMEKPTPEFIIDELDRSSWADNEPINKFYDAKQLLWKQSLENYGLEHIDEFDLTIIKLVENGFIEESGFIAEAKRLDAKFHASELQQGFYDAWSLFHNSFANNQDETINEIISSTKKAILYITPINLHGTIELLRQLEKNNEANELIDYYITHREEEHGLFDLTDNIFSKTITDPILKDSFSRKYEESYPSMSLIDAMKYMIQKNISSDKTIRSLNKASEEDFYELFKLEQGNVLEKMVKICLRFDQFPKHKSIAEKARNALMRIAKESKLNAIRVKRFGITIEE